MVGVRIMAMPIVASPRRMFVQYGVAQLLLNWSPYS